MYFIWRHAKVYKFNVMCDTLEIIWITRAGSVLIKDSCWSLALDTETGSLSTEQRYRLFFEQRT
jgi:hypothetical protein